MAERFSVLAISILALVGAVVEGPIACALHCAGSGEHVHAAAPVEPDSPVSLTPADGTVRVAAHATASLGSSETGAETDGAAPCPSLSSRGIHAVAAAASGPSMDETGLPDIDSLRPPQVAARLHLEAAVRPPGPLAFPLEHPPTA